jgi:predicted aminopeptidase
MWMVDKALRILALIVFSLVAPGCLSLRYVTQASAGQHELITKAVPLENAVASPQTPKRVRALLARVPDIKAFGEANGLRKTKNYTTYVDLHRQQVLWVVSASDPFAFRSRTWSFPIVGGFTYLGWFRRSDADAFAETLKREGLDVDVRPSRAYSTIGWFKDPVVSPMIREGVEALGDLVDVILHESTHATFFVAGQSALNESVAEFVGNTMSLRYLEQAQDVDWLERQRAGDSQEEDAARGAVMKAAYDSLEALYRGALSPAQRLTAKQAILDQLQRVLRMRRTPNNATLIQYKTYGSGHEQMRALLDHCGGSYPRFFATLEAARPTLERAKPQTSPSELLAEPSKRCVP